MGKEPGIVTRMLPVTGGESIVGFVVPFYEHVAQATGTIAADRARLRYRAFPYLYGRTRAF